VNNKLLIDLPLVVVVEEEEEVVVGAL